MNTILLFFMLKRGVILEFLKTKVSVFIDGLEVENFKIPDAEVFELADSNKTEVLKRYNPFSDSIFLTKKQMKRLIKILKKSIK